MDASNELNDIILNKHPKNDKTKKILLTIATFSIVLIIVVIAMNQFTSRKDTALPHLPESATKVTEPKLVHEPVFEVVEESTAEAEVETPPQASAAAEEPAETITVEETEEPKEALEVTVIEEPAAIKEPVYEESVEPAAEKVPVKPAPKPAKTVTKPKVERPSGKYDPRTKRVVAAETLPKAVAGQYYIQVGSFVRYAPSKAFLDKITERGYTYTFHEVTKNGKTSTKVLIGPFKTQTSARQALPVIKQRIVQGAFLIKL